MIEPRHRSTSAIDAGTVAAIRRDTLMRTFWGADRDDDWAARSPGDKTALIAREAAYRLKGITSTVSAEAFGKTAMGVAVDSEGYQFLQFIATAVADVARVLIAAHEAALQAQRDEYSADARKPRATEHQAPRRQRGSQGSDAR